MSEKETKKLTTSEAERKAQRQHMAAIPTESTVPEEVPLTDEQYFDKVMPQVSLKMNNLNGVDDFVNDECLDDLRLLNGAFRIVKIAQRSKVADELTLLGVAELFQKIWMKYFEMYFLSDDNKLMGANMREILKVMCNYTDSSHLLCERVYRINLYELILSYIGSTYLDPSKTSQKDFRKTISGLMDILHNMLRKVSDSRETLREKKAIDILQRFRSSPNEKVACKALILQVYINTEEENEIVSSDHTTFQFMKEMLENAFEYPDHYAKPYGLSAIRIIEALNRLAVNDNNKERIVSAGLLPLYVKMLQSEFTAEQAAAAEGIWTLEFRCATEVEKEPGCIQALENLVDTSSDDIVVTQAKGALWMLEKGKNGLRAAKDISRSGSLGRRGRYIFISYQWDNQQVIKKLRDSLRDAGYKVWIDINEVDGSILESMAKAVKNAVVVIICVTEKYKESPNCRTEAEFSHSLHKNIIPLLLQPRYKPDGWLGALTGNRLVYDFSSMDVYDSSFSALTKVLGDKGKASLADTGEDFRDIPNGLEVATPSKTNAEIPISVSNISNWSTEDVKTWLKKNGIKNFQNWMQEVDGSLLAEYRFMRQNAPETFYSMLEKKDFPIHDILRLSKALSQL